MCDLWRVVKGDHDVIDRLDLVDVDCSVVVIYDVVVVCQVTIAANVSKRDLIAVDLGKRGCLKFCDPVSIIGRSDAFTWCVDVQSRATGQNDNGRDRHELGQVLHRKFHLTLT